MFWTDFRISLFEILYDRLCGLVLVLVLGLVLATDPEARVGFPALPDFMRSNGCATGSTQPRENN
jgi:hypothetical protein